MDPERSEPLEGSGQPQSRRAMIARRQLGGGEHAPW